MRQLLFGTFTSLTVIALAGAAYAWSAGEYRNVAGPITGTYDTGIYGTFQMVPAAGTIGILSEGWGGACIIFRAGDVGLDQMAQKTCNKDDQCKQGNSNQQVTGYCDVTSHKCWARPTAEGADSALCRRFMPGELKKPMKENEVYSISTNAINIASLGVKPGAQARVLTCLHGVPWGGCADFAGSAKPLTDWGTPKQL